MKKIFIPLMTVVVVAALLLGCMPGAPEVTPPVTPPPVTPPVTPPPVTPEVTGAPPGVFVDPETGWWEGRMGVLAEDAPTFGIGFLADLSGTLGFWNAPRLVGTTAAYEWLCAHEYGIAGKRPLIKWYDHKSNADEAKAGYAKLRGKYIANHSCGTGEQQMLKPNYDPDKFLTLTCSQSPNVIYPVGYAFGIGPYWANQYAAFIDWVLEEGKGTKIAYITYPSGYGRAFITDETAAYNEEHGIEMVADIAVPWAPPDPDSILAAAKDAGAEIVFTNAMYATMGPLLKANYDGGYNLQFCVNNLSLDEATIALAGQTEDGKWRADGLVGISNYVTAADLETPDSPFYESEGMTALVEYWDTHFVKPEDRCGSYIQAWLEVFTYKEAIEETLVRLGSWDQVTSREIRLTMEGEDWWDRNIRDMWVTNFSPTNRDPITVRIMQVQDGKWIAITDLFTVKVLVPDEWLQPWID
ncbi:MAG: ABC transporter substrate-binding protein [Dehalococcoidia bacterium]|nr:MAG: ABC transporter substrate-binding protein [Dehalococcoidia bacterium]